ncbi:MAG: hypothetical protein R3E83_12615 [Burkholderiaceae bacterium]
MLLVLVVIIADMAEHNYESYRSAFAMRHELNGLTRQLEEAVEIAQNASLAKTRFLAAASHDLRQPLYTLQTLGGALRLRELDPEIITRGRPVGAGDRGPWRRA